MSGGSYNYLCYMDIDTIFNETRELESMIDRLSGLGYAADAAREAYELLLTIRQSQVRIEALLQRLSGVFKAVEWWDSADWTEKEVKEALRTYRGGTVETK